MEGARQSQTEPEPDRGREERERASERERERERRKERERGRVKERKGQTKTERQRDREKERQRDRETERQGYGATRRQARQLKLLDKAMVERRRSVCPPRSYRFVPGLRWIAFDLAHAWQGKRRHRRADEKASQNGWGAGGRRHRWRGGRQTLLRLKSCARASSPSTP
eukprot:2372203-Rhodomonas_salina.1